jgi:hypothetical protein
MKMGTQKVWGLALGVVLGGCSSGNEADQVGVASICEVDDDCPEVVIDGETTQLQCITDFSGGYCSIQGCDSAADCPDGSTCVAHDDGENYCFRECAEKSECNANRPEDDEANCSASFDYADPADDDGLKACIPPSSD